MGEGLGRGAFLLREMPEKPVSEIPMLPGFEAKAERISFTPTREAGRDRLDQFVGRAGRHYAGQRNYDFGPDNRSNVSALSPWIRHRLVTEEEVLRAILARHAPSAAEKFIQEVFWRTYFKGWLEQHPTVWTAYQKGLTRALEEMEANLAMASSYRSAVTGATGIDGFDQWSRELVETGYLHNHSRMWFASVWIFTLRLPWELGADFFLRHLMDGDPASNTLSWRWVGGLHTKGKTYQARAANISKYTDGRYRPVHKLSNSTDPLQEDFEHPRVAIPRAEHIPANDFILLVTEEDTRVEELLARAPAATFGVLATQKRSPLPLGANARDFAHGAVADALSRDGSDQSVLDKNWVEKLISKAQFAGVTSVVTPYAPIGPVQSLLAEAKLEIENAGLTLHQIRRDYDNLAWPHATKGFFALKKKIPRILSGLGLGG